METNQEIERLRKALKEMAFCAFRCFESDFGWPSEPESLVRWCLENDVPSLSYEEQLALADEYIKSELAKGL